MARVAGVDLPPQKRSQIGLTYIFGIGKSRATSILTEAQVDIHKKIRDLTEEELNRIRAIVDAQGNVEGDLRKAFQRKLNRLMETGGYRGLPIARVFRCAASAPTPTRAPA